MSAAVTVLRVLDCDGPEHYCTDLPPLSVPPSSRRWIGVSPERFYLDHRVPSLEVVFPPRFQQLPYVPGFGGHFRRAHCKCTVADEFVCGVEHPDRPESDAARERRLQAATVVSLREVRWSAFIGDLYGTGEVRGEPVAEKWKRASRARVNPPDPPRRDRKLTDDEWREALKWIKARPLRGALQPFRKEVAAQTWLELRAPPERAEPVENFAQEVRRAWERAKRIIREQNKTSWACPKPSVGGKEGDRRFF